MFLDFLVIYTYGYVKKDKHENWFMDNGKESVVYLIRIQKVFIHINKLKKMYKNCDSEINYKNKFSLMK